MTEDVPAFYGVVLAGGGSRRMGRDKALLRVGGRGLLETMVHRLHQSGAQEVVVSGDRPGYAHVPDREPERGPLGGLDSVLAAKPGLQGCLLLVVAVDTPFLDVASLRRLLAAAQRASGASYEGHPLPMALCADARLRECLRVELAPGGSRSVGALARAMSFLRLPAEHADLRNLNRPEDLAALASSVAP